MSDAREAELAAALSAVRARLDHAAAAAGRDAAEITLLPVTKFFPASDVLALYRLGCRDFGESREQEASAKVAEVARVRDEGVSDPIRWHMVGRIQRNKAKAVARWAYAAHSVDSAKVVAALDRGAAAALDEGIRTAPLRVYLQLSLDGDTERGGVDVDRPDLIDELCAAVEAAAALDFVGFMGIPPLGADPPAAFARLQQERDRVQRDHPQRLELSAGMSGDLEAAVQHGSTCVRVGTALMGLRPLASP
ncbi:YggS family pyridoxal phosphate enzyme [Mycobacterium sp. 852013-51886_SCH5428379]|uniref:YggS family pyridoxal phosphate-dependent enzyme n=1 Tax=Mycobacterium sp. 852013-51886_SCH5428379 TaxID=1834111 RepID=UPI0007FC03C4|nr:YggS family pyridoxal phosphate-dependent enzyme [Mycobacterium sp. 852013-51886_SCH5428379]OBB59345.1 YggS family pyridoxal phosphate enzyme [Mycobacterium sp. 852013-51886_SCH5428379]